MSFIILSTGRAGSGYIAKLLTNAGISTGHEITYNLSGYNPSNYIGESSWLALPFVEEGVYNPNTNIYHQVRHPLKVIGSLVNGEMQKYKDYFNYQTEHLPIRDDEDYLEYSIRFVYEWNRRIEKVTPICWRVESVDMNTLQMISFNEGIALDRNKATMALLGVSKTTNKHPKAKKLTWSDLPDTFYKERLLEQTKEYGYKE